MNFGLPHLCPYCRRDISLLSLDGTESCPFCGKHVWCIKMAGKWWYYTTSFAEKLFGSKQPILPTFDDSSNLENVLLSSGLVTAEQLREPANYPVDALARLVEDGVLTCWQVWQLYGNRTPVFFAEGYKFLDLLKEEPGEIYLCAESGNEVILKFPSNLGERGLYRELNAAHCANSPTIAPCRGTTMVNGRVCLIRDYLEGITVAEKTVPIELSVHVISETAKALHQLHVGGHVHRCIKPQKVLLSRDGSVRLFGSGRCEPLRDSAGEKGARMDVYNLLRVLGYMLEGYDSTEFTPSYHRMSPIPCFDVEFTRSGTESSLIAVCEDFLADLRSLSPLGLADKLSAWLASYDPLSPA